MVFRPADGDLVEPGSSAEISYRLTRQAAVNDVLSGTTAREDACDAHPELIRAAREVGDPTNEMCPICDNAELRHVTYVFGPRLPKHGRCVTLRGELNTIAKRQGTFVAYVVECCPACHWNHLHKRYVLPDRS